MGKDIWNPNRDLSEPDGYRGVNGLFLRPIIHEPWEGPGSTTAPSFTHPLDQAIESLEMAGKCEPLLRGRRKDPPILSVGNVWHVGVHYYAVCEVTNDAAMAINKQVAACIPFGINTGRMGSVEYCKAPMFDSSRSWVHPEKLLMHCLRMNTYQICRSNWMQCWYAKVSYLSFVAHLWDQLRNMDQAVSDNETLGIL